MIEGKKFIETVKTYFGFLITEFGFKVSGETINGNYYYNVMYLNPSKAANISFEWENHWSVCVSLLQDGKLPDYDDTTRTLHLGDLNRLIMPGVSKDEIISNNRYFSTCAVTEKWERAFLKAAKELRLCLKHFDTIHPESL